jgi:DNA topoisomerase-1
MRRGKIIISEAMTDEEKKRRDKKIKSIRTIASNIHKLRRRVTKDLKSDDEKTKLTALAVAIMDKTAERVGNDESAKGGHFGVTGFKNKHIEVEGNTITIKYVGKSGVDQEKKFTDKLIAGILKDCKGRCDNKEAPILSTDDGFKIKADKVNRYLRDFDITAKDIRGYSANRLMTESLKNADISSDEKERKKKFQEVLKSVAERVGHQKATLKLHYLLPSIENDYVGKGKVVSLKEASCGRRIKSFEDFDKRVKR